MVLKTALRRVLAAAGADAAEASPEENNEDYREAALASLSRQLLGGGAVAESGISADTADHLRLLRQRLQLAHDHHARKLELDHRRQEAAAAPILSEVRRRISKNATLHPPNPPPPPPPCQLSLFYKY